jgi:hypothetical protein
MSEPTEPTTHQIPGWDRPAWAVRGVKDRDELTWIREASVDVTYQDGGVEDTFALELVQYITPDQARILAQALVELADYADGMR